MRTNTHKKLSPSKKQETISSLYDTFLKIKKAQGIKKETLNSYAEALQAINKYQDIGKLSLSNLDAETPKPPVPPDCPEAQVPESYLE